jgi:hypothetical protein
VPGANPGRVIVLSNQPKGLLMLNSDDRRPAFDAFFRSLDPAAQTVFIHAAIAQRDGIQDGEEKTVSLIDCMENVWDFWTELRTANPSHLIGALYADDRAVAALMLDPEREAREREFRGIAGLNASYPRSA